MKTSNKIAIIFIILYLIGFFTQYSALNLEPWIFKRYALLAITTLCLAPQIIKILEKIKPKYFCLMYFCAILMLIIVATIGNTAMGAKRWINFAGFNIQPSEFMKIAVVYLLSYYFACVKMQNKFVYVALALILIAIPGYLIFLQPNLGTTIILFLISFTIMFAALESLKPIFFIFASILFASPFIWMYKLQDYQKKRILTFIAPEKSSKDERYNVAQSQIAIGSGEFYGEGYLCGKQNKLAFIPEKHTDFIFSVFGEEFGFLGVLILFILYCLFFLNVTIIIVQSRNQQARLMMVGCSAIIFWHIFINIGMTTGILPVVGIPLPFLSYGGSFLAANTITACIIYKIAKEEEA